MPENHFSRAGNRVLLGARERLFSIIRRFPGYRNMLLSKGEPSPLLDRAHGGRRALVIDATTPTPDMDSGSVDAIYLMKILQRLGYLVTFAPDDFIFKEKYTAELRSLGVQCISKDVFPSLALYIELFGCEFDLAILSRVSCAAKHVLAIRKFCPKAKVLFNTVDLHYLREARRAELECSALLARQAEETKARELMAMQKCDATIVISEAERAIIKEELPSANVAVLPYVREVRGCRAPFSERKDIAFVGGFLHNPNIDAATYFVREIWPMIREELPGVRFHVVGSNMPPEVTSLGQEPGVVVRGYVPDIEQVMDQFRLTVAPLRYGAGIKGKIGTSLSCGVPCVATPVAVEGMGLSDGMEILIATGGRQFASSTIAAYRNEALWNSLSESGLGFMAERFSFERGVERMKALLDSVGLTTHGVACAAEET